MTSPQESSHRLMYHIGSALSQWQGVEAELCGIFGLFLGPHSIANAVFNAVINLNTKIRMVEAALYAGVADSDALAEWDRLRERVEAGAKKRNKLAHHGVILDSRKGEAFLMPNPMDAKEFVKSYLGKGTRHSWKDIEQFGQSFNELRHQLSEFHLLVLLPLVTGQEGPASATKPSTCTHQGIEPNL